MKCRRWVAHNNMDKKQIVKIAAQAMKISEKNLKYCINEYPDGYFIWEPVSKGKTMFLDFSGNYLIAKKNMSFKDLYDNFKSGKRTNIKTLEDVLEEIKEEFSV